ncbi:DegT/DnrJ/EryC1/StrS aminotransferase family protein [Synechococcus sp. PCC 6312]|uniref:DegT/DnrJ/EryC1/StrS family aminotransferase n=1 Tax=Synechococcus sp. (strain ATCC 27167 / PCC 6312) TaxID=195253 RepID=UPI00029F4172|nr:DegT/DnrJ/EryC1/StrS family aminotransferase [Synechococcus sp. PCC 6312]AFY61459.1 putative PLP-dependent enzyme possibly involved in cell wall biogenesis [Synechococcus sp. PCC 6312]
MQPSKIPILDLKPQYQALKTEIQAAIDRVLESGQFILGPDVTALENELAQFLGVRFAIAVNSGTDALIISLRALGIGPGDEVITTPFSFFATAESITLVGARPVFVDICPETFNINPTLIAAAITSRTKAIMPVHLFGQPARMGEILEIAQAHDLKVIEDTAQAIGAQYFGTCLDCQCQAGTQQQLQGKFVGGIGDMGAFSFFPTKNLGAYGDGGLITTNDPELAELAKMLRVHGSRQRYIHEMIGYNSRMDSIQAAILRVKLPHLKSWNEQRRQIAQTYNQTLADIPGIITPKVTPGHVFHQYTVRVLDNKRDQVIHHLAGLGISTMIYYPIPQNRLTVYDNHYPPLSVSDQLATEVLSLPLWPELAPAQIAQITQALGEAIRINS